MYAITITDGNKHTIEYKPGIFISNKTFYIKRTLSPLIRLYSLNVAKINLW